MIFFSGVIDAYKKVRISPYIVGGRDSKIEHHPYQVLMEIALSDRTLRCSGSIISETHVITAAHCLHERKPTEFTLWYGSTSDKQLGKKYFVKHIDIHPKYDLDTTDYDVGMIWVRIPLEKIPSLRFSEEG